MGYSRAFVLLQETVDLFVISGSEVFAQALQLKIGEKGVIYQRGAQLLIERLLVVLDSMFGLQEQLALELVGN